MNRREFTTFIGAAIGWPHVARAQQSAPLIGFISSRGSKDSEPHVAGFLQGLADAGYAPRQNVGIEYRWADGDYDRLRELAAELVRLRPAVIVAAGGEPSAIAAKAASAVIPVVFVIGGDPVKAGLTASLNRPGTTATGVSFVTTQLGGKRLNLIGELVPNARTIGLLVNPKVSEADIHVQSVRQAADTLQRRLVVLPASTPAEIEASFASIAEEGIGALVVQNDPFFDSQRTRLIDLAAQHALPAIYHIRDYPAAGGLMSYGASLVDAYKEVGAMTARILKGERPQEMPVVQPTRFELVINSKTARSLRLTIPAQMLAIADEVIE